MTASSAIHWFQVGGLREIHRVLVEKCALVVYDVWYRAEMTGEPAFAEWMRDGCGPHYPSVEKHEHGP